jgi:site-specific DNA recombinase
VDRLTRSLSDFAKLVELFDACGVSFISVTQSFNTTTSMGRLTLNMLLSFAQFEREITGERIRDKVAASKKKGIWMGGAVPIGYRVESRALHIVETEANFVRMLFRRYLELGSVVRLKATLDAGGIVTPTRVAGTGRASGGKRLSRGHLYWILSNPIYIGRLRHKGQEHVGLHSGVIEPETWRAVQEKLASQTQSRREGTKDELSFLAGKLFDNRGHRMGATFAAKGSRRWRYYVSRAALTGRNDEVGAVAWVSAPTIEAVVIEAVKRHRSEAQGRNEGRRVLSNLDGALAHNELTPDQKLHAEAAAALAEAIERVTLNQTQLEIAVSGWGDDEETTSTIVVPWKASEFRRRRDIIQSTAPDSSPKRAMRVRARGVFAGAIVDAHRWLDELLSDPTTSIAALADRERKSERSIHMTLSLAFLSPDLVKAAIDGNLPRGFNMTRLVDLPILWSEQWSALGLKRPMCNRGA